MVGKLGWSLAFVAFLGFLTGAWAWAQHVDGQTVQRQHFYIRALDIEVARRATETTAKLFRQTVMLPDSGTGGTQVPCPLTAAELRATGPGECWLANYGIRSQDLPSYCEIYPCVAISLAEAEWRDPAVREGILALRRRPRAICEARERETDRGWRNSGDMVECGPWAAFRGRVFVGIYGKPAPTEASIAYAQVIELVPIR